MDRTLKQFARDGDTHDSGQGRECGACTACCTVMAVHELQKANYEPCCHLTDRCSIYATRPDSCREWSCLWLKGLIEGDERRRPDQLGLVLSLDESGVYPMITAYEVWEGAALQPKAKYILDRLGKWCNVVLVNPQNQFVVLSPNALFKAALTPAIEIPAPIADVGQAPLAAL